MVLRLIHNQIHKHKHEKQSPSLQTSRPHHRERKRNQCLPLQILDGLFTLEHTVKLAKQQPSRWTH